MQKKPTYEELERSIKKLENEVLGRKRAEEALRETRDYLENLFNYANAPIIVWDTEAKITRFNHACEHLTGFTADEVIGQKVHILFPEASREESLSKIASTLSGEYWESVEIPTLHKTGDIRTALWNSANICAEDGTTVVATIAQGQDITERKRAEERIKHLNSVLRSIRNVNQLITREKNRERLIQRTCEELFETRGCHSAWIVLMDESHKVFTSAETGLGQKFSLISERLERGQLTPCCKRAVTQEGVVTIEDPLSNCRDCPVSQMYEGRGALAMRLQHGGKMYGVLVISVSSDFVTDKEEHALFAEVAGDIAFALHSIELEEQRKQAEEELRESEELYGSILESMSDGILALDQNFHYTHWNRAMERISKTPRERVIGNKKLPWEIFPHLTEQGMDEMMRKAMGGESVQRPDIPYRLPDGTEGFTTEVFLPLKTSHGKIRGVVGVVSDVTDRKQAEETLRASEEKYRTLIETTSEGYWLIDAERKTLEVNQSLCDMLGYGPEEMIGKTPLDFVDDENRKVFKSQMGKIKETPHRTYEITLKSTTGKDIHTNFSATTIFDESRAVKGSFAFVTDISERKQAQQRIKHLNAVLRSIRNVNQLITKEKDPDRLIQGVCNNLVETRGYHNAWIALFDESGHLLQSTGPGLGKEFLSMVEMWKHGKLTRCAQNALTRTGVLVIEDPSATCADCPLAKGYGGREAMNVRLEHAETIYGMLTVSIPQEFASDQEEQSLLQEVAGDIAFALHSIELVKERQRAEQALKESEKRYRTQFEEALDAIFIADAETGILTDCNHAASELVGRPKSELVGKHQRTFHPPEEVEGKFSGTFKEHLEEKKGQSLEAQVITKDGEIRDVSIKANIFETSGRRFLQGIFRDITPQKRAAEEKKRLESQLLQAQKMETIGTLAGGIAHDFNNLLMAAQGNVSLMLYDVDSTHPHYDLLKNIEKEIKSGATLTRHLLGYARKGKYDVKPINLNEIVKETSDTLGRTRKDTAIHRELAEDLFAVEADPGQIEQVLLNLYVNATDAMPGGGDLILKTTNMAHDDIKDKLYDPKPGNYVLLTVTDTGPGMDKETRKHIFDPFFTTKEMGRGTGLGLASVYGIIKSHGGYIDVESEIGHGTTFAIYLPATERRVEKSVLVDEQIIKGTETILLVDDEERIMAVGVRVLNRLGYTVLEAKGGREAVEIYKENKDKIDMVILDMIMPDMGGGKAYDRMKEINPKVKVLLSSGYSIDGEAEEILARGCDGFISKPFTMKELSQSIREVLCKG